MVAVGKQHTGDMRHGEAYETYGPAERCDGTGEHCRGYEQHAAGSFQVESHRYGIFFAEQQHVERLYGGDSQYKTGQNDRYHGKELVCGDVAERPHGPDDESFQSLLPAEVLEYLDNSAYA